MLNAHTFHPDVDRYLAMGCGRCPKGGTPDCFIHQWQPIMTQVRACLLALGLQETLKWQVPCYTFNGENVVILHGFKHYAALNFFKGVLLSDPDALLVAQTDTIQATRQIRLTSMADWQRLEASIQRYVAEAIELARLSVKVPLKQTRDFDVPTEFADVLAQDTALKQAFEALTPGRQRGYLLHFAAPKQSKTRLARIDKARNAILNGKGLHD